jgi:hypothetical protein
VVASPTSLRLARQGSASHDKAPPRTTSPAPTSAWAKTHSSGEATDVCGEANFQVTRERQLAAVQATCPGKSFNASLTSHAAITSPSTSTLPHAKLSPSNSLTLYDLKTQGMCTPHPSYLDLDALLETGPLPSARNRRQRRRNRRQRLCRRPHSAPYSWKIFSRPRIFAESLRSRPSAKSLPRAHGGPSEKKSNRYKLTDF